MKRKQRVRCSAIMNTKNKYGNIDYSTFCQLNEGHKGKHKGMMVMVVEITKDVEWD